MMHSVLRFRNPANDKYELLGYVIERQPNEPGNEAILLAMMAEQNTKFELVNERDNTFIFRPVRNS